MIEKVIKIKNVGKYRGFNASGDVTLARLTLVYGGNARGKSTLAAIFKSLSERSLDRVVQRQSFGTSESPEVQIRHSNGNLTCNNGGWSGPEMPVHVFDGAYVHEHLYAGDTITVDHRRNLLKVVLGSKGVKLAKQVDQLTEQISDATSGLELAKRTLEGKCNQMPAAWLAQQKPVPNVDELIEECSAALKAATDSSKLLELPLPGALTPCTLPNNLLDILKKSVDGLTQEVTEHIAAHITRLGANAEDWIAKGVGFGEGTEGTCPFCGLDLSASELSTSYAKYFGEHYKQLKLDVESLGKETRLKGGSAVLNQLDKALSEAEVTMAKWSPYVKVDLPVTTMRDTVQGLKSANATVLKALTDKSSAPLDPPKNIDDLTKAIDTITRAGVAIEAYNADVETQLASVKSVRSRSQSADPELLKKKLAEKQAIKKLSAADSQSALASYTAAEAKKAKLESEKREARIKLDEYSASIPSDYEASINQILSRFGCDFALCSSRRENTGGKPSLNWSLRFDDTHEISLTGTGVAEGPTFATVLSSGDRSALAFAFFAVQVSRDEELPAACVLFDDPFTSQDAGRRSQTVSEIAQIAQKTKQMIVLSHEYGFLREVHDRAPDPAQVKSLALNKVAGVLKLDLYDLVAASESMSVRDLRDLNAYIDSNQGAPIDIIRKLRPSLETWLRRECPGVFPEGAGWLGEWLSKIRDASASDSYFSLKPHYRELEDLNEYSKKYHHGEPTTDSVPTPNDDELTSYSKRAVALVGL